MRVARAVRDGVLEVFPGVNVDVHILWTNILETDGAKGATRAAKVFDDERVQQYWDPERRLGHQLAPVIGMPTVEVAIAHAGDRLADWEEVFAAGFVHGPATAFDTVFFYPPGVTWGDAPPTAASWVTQLDPGIYPGIDVERFRFGAELQAELERLARALLAPEAPSGH